MPRLFQVQEKVKELYTKQHADKSWQEWLSWAYPNHVCIVEKEAQKLAERFGGNVEYSCVGALLHDIADAELTRDNPAHHARSEELARVILKESGFSSEEIEQIVVEVIAPHSCRELMPTVFEGKILATADALAHLSTDFYIYFAWQHWGNKGGVPKYSDFREWVLSRIERDFYKKIWFDEIRQENEHFYRALKESLSSTL